MVPTCGDNVSYQRGKGEKSNKKKYIYRLRQQGTQTMRQKK